MYNKLLIEMNKILGIENLMSEFSDLRISEYTKFHCRYDQAHRIISTKGLVWEDFIKKFIPLFVVEALKLDDEEFILNNLKYLDVDEFLMTYGIGNVPEKLWEEFLKFAVNYNTLEELSKLDCIAYASSSGYIDGEYNGGIFISKLDPRLMEIAINRVYKAFDFDLKKMQKIADEDPDDLPEEILNLNLTIENCKYKFVWPYASDGYAFLHLLDNMEFSFNFLPGRESSDGICYIKWEDIPEAKDFKKIKTN